MQEIYKSCRRGASLTASIPYWRSRPASAMSTGWWRGSSWKPTAPVRRVRHDRTLMIANTPRSHAIHFLARAYARHRFSKRGCVVARIVRFQRFVERFPWRGIKTCVAGSWQDGPAPNGGVMCADETAHAGAEIRRLFAGLDVAEEASAVLAMQEVAALLRQPGLSFRQVVQQIEARGLLLPTKIGTAIQLMDSETLLEAESALGAARRLMKSCGLTFERIIAAFEHGSANSDEIEQLRRTNQAAVDEIQQLRAAQKIAFIEIEQLRRAHLAAVAQAQKMRAELRVNSFLVAAAVLVILWLASTILSLLRSEGAKVPTPVALTVMSGGRRSPQ